MPTFLESIGAIFVASLPGVAVALLSHFLQQRRDNLNLQRLYASAHRLLALEVGNNLARMRYSTYTKLATAVQQVTGAPSPMGQ